MDSNKHWNKIPEEMKSLPQWCFSMPLKKVPLSPFGEFSNASTVNRKTWGTFEQACESVKSVGGNIGFMLSEEDPYVIIDLDTKNLSDDKAKLLYKNIMSGFDSYIEKSMSGNGFHIVVKGKISKGAKDPEQQVEVYGNKRYMIIAGDRISKADQVLEAQQEIDDVLEDFSNKKNKVANYDYSSQIKRVMDNAKIIKKASSAKSGEKFKRLFEDGDFSKYKSQSEADMALMCMISYYTRNADQTVKIFRESQLGQRKKALRDDYVYGLFEAAISNNQKLRVGMDAEKRVIRFLQSSEFTCDDIGRAKIFRSAFGERFRCAPGVGWLHWDETIWCRVSDAPVCQGFHLLHEILMSFVQYVKSDRREEYFLFCKQGGFNSVISNTIKVLMTLDGINIPFREFDKRPYLLGVNNGILDLQEGKLFQADPKYLISKKVSVEYNDLGECPKWYQFLDDIFEGDQSIIDFIQTAVGYSLCGNVNEQCLFFLFGYGSNGKSTFLETILSLFGDYGQRAPSSLFTKDKYGAPSNTADVARLNGVRLSVGSEVEEGGHMAESKIKDLTGGDKLTARALYKGFSDFEPTHKLWIAGNHKPRIKGTDNGIWRRIRLIPFNASFTDDQKDPFLMEKLKKELPGILNWAIEGFLKWQKQGLKVPKSIQRETNIYRDEEDGLGHFIDAKIVGVSDLEERLDRSEVYSSYEFWCKNEGLSQLGSTRFYKLMKSRGFKEKKSNGAYFYLGVKPYELPRDSEDADEGSSKCDK